MILYWTIIGTLLFTAGLCADGYAAARHAGSTGWRCFHAVAGFGAAIAASLFAMIAAPIAHQL